MGESSKILDSSYLGLHKEDTSSQMKIQRKALLPKIKTEEREQIVSPQRTHNSGSPTKIKKPRIIPPGYEMADYNKAIEHWNKNSYTRKIEDSDGDVHYEQYSIFDDLTDLKQYGLGVYLYQEFIKRLLLTSFIISVLMILPLYLNYYSQGLSEYKDSFTLTLAKFTIGNLYFADQKTYLLESIADVLGMLVLFAFYFHWRSFHNTVVSAQEKDFRQLDPTMYVVSVVGFDPKTPNLEQQLLSYFDTTYRGAYEVEVVHDFNRNFSKFIDYEELIEEVQKQKQVIRQTDKSNEKLTELEKQLEEQQEKLAKISNQFDPIYAIIHFRNLKAKYAFINVCKKYGLVNKLGYHFKRCICCMPGLPEKMKFMKKSDIMIESVNLARPDSINWDNTDISKCSYVSRFILSMVFIAVSIFITSSLIALCTLYVATSSNCGGFDADTTLAQAQALNDKLVTYCYCSVNYASIYTDNAVETYCASLQQTILISNIVQVAASLVSTVTNIILIVIVSIIAEKLLKPDTKPKEYNFVFICVFISNLINSTILPLILNGDIFGFKSVSYLGFISFINVTKVNVFKDFDRNWFAVISPYYTNFFIIAAISPFIEIIVYFVKRRLILWRLRSKCEHNDPSSPTIQKQADQLVCQFPIDLPVQMAVICLQFFMCFMYSCLIPLAIPIFTLGVFTTFFCKRYIILNYTKRIPADEGLNEKIINLIPFILVVHGLMGIWARTSDGLFDTDSFFYVIDLNILPGTIIQRAVKDIIILGATAVVLLWIIFDFTIVTCFSFLKQSCKDQLELPVTFVAIENVNYAERLKQTNIFGSYKLSNHPVYKHPYKAFEELKKRVQQEKQEQLMQKDNQMGSSQFPSQLHLTSKINPY